MKNKIFSFFRKTRVWVIILVIGIGSISWMKISDNDFKILKSLDIYFSLFKELNMYYVDETDPEKLMKVGVDAMLESLDPYTNFIPESELDDFKFMTTGEYGGVGSLIRKKGDFVTITDPYENFPAQKAGLKAGDVIIEVNGKSCKGNEVSDVSALLKGTPGTDVELLIQRPGIAAPLKFTLKRQKISIPSISYYTVFADSVGYLRLSSFTVDASKEMRDVIIELKKRNAKSLVIDLRGNPGGLLDEAIKIANMFLPKGQEVVSTRGKVKQMDKTYLTSDEPLDTVMPLVVLVNRGSASASEIVSGSLQDLDRAVIIGQRTYGKGLVQSTRPLSYNAQLKLTTAKYYIPSGRCIQAIDYSHRNEDGSVAYVPDSLRKEFKTRNKRKVFDGGGITPDITLIPDTFSKIAFSLVTKDFIFDFATSFAQTHASIPRNFTVSDELYDQFLAYIKNKDFDYQTKSEEMLNKLADESKKEAYYDNLKTELDNIKVKLSHNKNNDLQRYKGEICELIASEIISRYYYQWGRSEYLASIDPEIKKGVSVLQNVNECKLLLNPAMAVRNSAKKLKRNGHK